MFSFMNHHLRIKNGLAWLGIIATATAGFAAPKSEKAPANAPTTFAKMPATNELASVWNDPEFTRHLIGTYGFASDVEPRMKPEELATYRDKIVPLLRDDQKKAAAELALLTKPDATPVFDFTLGNIAFQNEDLTNAVTHFQAAISKFPDYRRAHKNLGFALVRDGRNAEAIKPLTKTIYLGGGDGKVLGLLGFSFMSIGKNVSAEAAYRQALVFEPENLDFKLGLVKSSIATANYDYALALLDELIKEYPDRENLWSLQANIYIQREQPAKAALSLEMLRRVGKANAQSLFLLGDLYMAQDSYDLALNSYLEAIQTDGGQNAARALRAAQILVNRSAWTEANQMFARIRQGTTALSAVDELKLLKLESKAAMANGAGDKAIATLEQIIQKDPLDGEALLLAGDYYSKSGQKEKAELRYHSAASISGFEADAFVKHAQLLVQSQKYANATELLKKAQKLKPRDNVQRYLDKVEQLARNSAKS